MISVFPFVTFKKPDFNFLIRFSFFIFVWNFENGLQVVFRFSFSANGSETDNLCFSGNIQETKMAAIENVLDKDFVRRFLIEQKHIYEELVSEIKARYPNLKGCSLRSVKSFCNHQGIRKECRFRMKRLSAALAKSAPLDFPS